VSKTVGVVLGEAPSLVFQCFKEKNRWYRVLEGYPHIHSNGQERKL
jgi:hypothetical protein